MNFITNLSTTLINKIFLNKKLSNIRNSIPIFLFRDLNIETENDALNIKFKDLNKLKPGDKFHYYYSQDYTVKGTYNNAKDKMKRNCNLVILPKKGKKRLFYGKSYEYEIIKEDDINNYFQVKYYFEIPKEIITFKNKVEIFKILNLPIPGDIVTGIIEVKVNEFTNYAQNIMKQLIYIFDVSSKVLLLCKNCQKSKTQYIIDLILNRKNKTIFFVDNYLNQKDQLMSRLAKLNNTTIKSLSGEGKLTDENLEEYLKCDIIIACSNKTQVLNVDKILNKSNEKFDIYIDEIDSRLNTFTKNNFLKNQINNKNVYKIGLITATPLKLFNHFEENNLKLGLYQLKINNEEEEKYHKIENTNYKTLKDIKEFKTNAKIFHPSGHTVNSHEDTMKKMIENYKCDAVIVMNKNGFNLFKNKKNEKDEYESTVINKKKIKEMLNNEKIQKLLIKILKEKNIDMLSSLRDNIKSGIIEYKDESHAEIDYIKNKHNFELSELLPLVIHYFNLEDRRVGITGKSCIGRGITINSPHFMITDAIFEYTKVNYKNISNYYQICGRICGLFNKWKNYNKINFYSNIKFREQMLAIEKVTSEYVFRFLEEIDNHKFNYVNMLGDNIITENNDKYIYHFRKYVGEIDDIKQEINDFVGKYVPDHDKYHFKEREILDGFIIEKYDSNNKSKKSCKDIVKIKNTQNIQSHLGTKKALIKGSHRVYFCYEDINDKKTLCAYYKFAILKSSLKNDNLNNLTNNIERLNLEPEIIEEIIDIIPVVEDIEEINYKKMKVVDLKKLCKKRKIKGYSKLKKQQLLDILQ
jgi:hypothetical protein